MKRALSTIIVMFTCCLSFAADRKRETPEAANPSTPPVTFAGSALQRSLQGARHVTAPTLSITPQAPVSTNAPQARTVAFGNTVGGSSDHTMETRGGNTVGGGGLTIVNTPGNVMSGGPGNIFLSGTGPGNFVNGGAGNQIIVPAHMAQPAAPFAHTMGVTDAHVMQCGDGNYISSGAGITIQSGSGNTAGGLSGHTVRSGSGNSNTGGGNTARNGAGNVNGR